MGESMGKKLGTKGIMPALVFATGMTCPAITLAAEPLIDTSRLINLVSNRLFEVGISAARSLAEIEYDSITFNETLSTISINGLVVKPLPEQGLSGCTVSIGNIAIASSTAPHVSKDTVEFGLDDLRLAPTCLPFEARGTLAMAGVSTLAVPSAKVEVTYDYPSGGAELSIHGELADAFGFSLHLDFPYFSIIDDYTPIHARIDEAELTVFNKGIWENVSIQLPAQVTQPGFAGDFVAELVGDALFYDQSSVETQRFMRQVANAWEDFLAVPSQITLRSNITTSGGLLLEPDLLEDPARMINFLAPSVYSGTRLPQNAMPSQDIKAIIYGNFSGFSDEVLLQVGDGFLSGLGYPRNEAVGLKILNYLAMQGVKGTSHILAKHYLGRQNYALAYEFALEDSAEGSARSVNILNVAEPFLDLSEILELQDGTGLDLIKAASGVQPEDYYRFARASMSGKGMRKSYLAAYFWSILAQANGDRRTASLLAKIEALGAAKDLAAAVDWDAQLAQAQADALLVWMERN